MRKYKNTLQAAACLMTLSLFLCGCGSKENTEKLNTESAAEAGAKDITVVGSAAANENTAAANTAAVLPPDQTGADKTEMIYVTADAYGTPEKTEVTVTLKAASDGSDIQDISDLKDIRNSGGDEELTQNGSEITWQNLGQDVTYKGESDNSTPVTVAVSYLLDGSTITPEELAGKSGKVTIRIDYENQTAQTEEIDGKEYNTIIPYAAITAVLLPEDHFANIEVENGNVMSLDGQCAVVGYAVPGLSEALGLADYEATEDVELPEYVEITADCVDFELDFTATVLANGLFKDTSDDDFDDLDELRNDLQDLGEAGDELTDAILTASDGASTLSNYMNQDISGVNTFADSLLQAGSGIQTLSEQQSQLASVTSQLSTGLSQLNASISEIDMTETDSISAAFAQLSSDAASLQAALTTLQETINAIASFASEAQAYENAVVAAAASADENLSSVDLNSLNAEAKAQASAAVASMLDSLGLTEEQLTPSQRQAIIDAAASGIDLSGDIASAQNSISAARTALSGIPDLTIPDLNPDISSVTSAISALQTDAQTLINASDTMSSMSSAISVLQDSLAALSQAAAGVDQGTAAISAALTSVADGLSGMETAVNSLKTAGSSIASGVNELTSGMAELYDGMKEFNEEGLQEIADFADTDLQDLLGRIKALRLADTESSSFTGNIPGTTVETSYIIETAEIRAK